MYLKSVRIENVKSIHKFEMSFAHPAGWHVLIGDNGSGKSTIVRAISLVCIGPNEALGLRLKLSEWMTPMSGEGFIQAIALFGREDGFKSEETCGLTVGLFSNGGFSTINGMVDSDLYNGQTATDDQKKSLWNSKEGCFTVGYGPFRRFSGGSAVWEELDEVLPRASAHFSIFGEDVALTEAIKWLQHLNYQRLEKKSEAAELLECLTLLINESGLLPHGVKLKDISSSGISFEDGFGALVSVSQLSEGFRSILSLTFDLIRQLHRVYSQNDVLRLLRLGKTSIDLPGVVLIDEIDAHLHPTWQTRIGKWFTTVFPAMQFIVTTHSPLVCRAAENGSIWRLASPGSGMTSGEVIGIDRDRLIYGSVLDAYGTEIFGEGLERSPEGQEKMRRLAELNIQSIRSKLSRTEQTELDELKNILPSSSESLDA